MFDRANLKSKARNSISFNYWRCVLVSLVIGLAGGVVSFSVSGNNGLAGSTTFYYNGHYVDPRTMAVFRFALLLLIALISVIALAMAALCIFVLNLLQVGGSLFYMENAYRPSKAGRLFFSFKEARYLRTVNTMFMRDLFIFLWSLLFIVPGIIKSYEYRMVPYLMADCPELSRKDAFRISREMMDGNKGAAFVLDLSFIGWAILSAMSCGLLAVFYLNPYRHSTNAELFLELKRQYFAKRGQTDL